MAGKEREKGHERLIDYDFRVPSIEGLGSGDGFQIKDLVLPRNYEKLVRENPRAREVACSSLDVDCSHFNLPQGFIEFDSETGVLKQIFFGGLGFSPGAVLGGDMDENGYYLEDVSSYLMALVINKTICDYLNNLERASLLKKLEKMKIGESFLNQKYAYPNYYYNGLTHFFFSSNLTVPMALTNKAKNDTENEEYFKQRFEVRASNLVGQFGLTLSHLGWENKFLRDFGISEGNACDYGVEGAHEDDNKYGPHNVDTPKQAFALHAVGAAYINELLERRDLDRHR